MMYVNCLDCEVPPAISQLFVQISHLEPVEAFEHLINEVLDDQDTIANCWRIMNFLWLEGFAQALKPGTGQMVFAETIMGTEPDKVKSYLRLMVDRLNNSSTEEAALEYTGTILVIISYYHFLLVHTMIGKQNANL